MHTVSKLEQHLTDTDITSILGCTNAVLANKKILDSLIVNMKCREDLLDLCDRLEKISESPNMTNIVHELRNGMLYACMCAYVCSCMCACTCAYMCVIPFEGYIYIYISVYSQYVYVLYCISTQKNIEY